MDERLQHPRHFEFSEDEKEDINPGVVFLHPLPEDENMTPKKPSSPHKPSELEAQQVEKLQKKHDPKSSRLAVWIGLNILATIAIVFVNKTIFSESLFRNAQLSFASFHFFITFATLHLASSRRLQNLRAFERQRARLIDITPLAGAMCLNVILPNLSLAHSSVTFYQTARVLLTPVVAILNFSIYGIRINKYAAYTLIPVCIGVGMITYFDIQPEQPSTIFMSFIRPKTSQKSHTNTSLLGLFFATSGVLASSIYTIWISAYHKKTQLSSIQLLHNQSLVGAVMLLCAIPIFDTLPIIQEVPRGKWIMVLFSGICAIIINLSQFIIIVTAGPVSSTVVGHVKTISIVTLGWSISGKSISDKSVFGAVVAVGGIVLYSYVTHRNGRL